MWIWQNKPDQELLDLIRQGDEEGLKYLYRQNYSMVRKYVIDNSGSLQDVDDVLQDGVIAVWKNVSKSSFELKSQLSTYFMAIVKNLWLKKLRKDKRKVGMEEVQFNKAAGHVEMRPEKKMDMHVVKALLDEVGDTCKELLGLFYFEQMDNISIAERMNFSNSDVVKAKKYQCLKKLKVKFFEKYSENDFK